MVPSQAESTGRRCPDPGRCPTCGQPVRPHDPETDAAILDATTEPDEWTTPTAIAYTARPCRHVTVWRRAEQA